MHFNNPLAFRALSLIEVKTTLPYKNLTKFASTSFETTQRHRFVPQNVQLSFAIQLPLIVSFYETFRDHT